jgi:hypothetical protein
MFTHDNFNIYHKLHRTSEIGNKAYSKGSQGLSVRYSYIYLHNNPISLSLY